MKKIIYISVALFFFQSCQIEDDEAPSPEDSFIRYYGDLTSFQAKDLELVSEGGSPSGFVVLGSRLDPDVDQEEFYVLRTDLNGNVIQSTTFGFTFVADPDPNFQLVLDTIPLADINQDGSVDNDDAIRGNSIPGRIKQVDNGFLVVGSTSINNRSLLTIALLNTNLEVVVFWLREGNPDDPLVDLIGNDIIGLAAGGILVVGKIGPSDGSDYDNYILKLTSSGIEFEKNFGVEGSNEEVIRVFERVDEELVLIGHGNTNSRLGENGGNNGQNAYFIELDENGNPINSKYYGVDDPDQANTAVYNESVVNAIEISSGFVIAGTSTTSQNENYGFAISVDNNGDFISGSSLPSSSFVEGEQALQTRISGITQSLDNNLILVGQYPEFNANGIGKSGEALFMKVDQSVMPLVENESNFGLTDGNDEFVDAITLPDGSIVVVGNIDFGAGAKLVAIVKLNDTGNLQD